MKKSDDSHQSIVSELDSAGPHFAENTSDLDLDVLNKEPSKDLSKENIEKSGSEPEPEPEPKSYLNIETLKQELLAAQEKAGQYLEHLKRNQADMENIKHRIKRDADKDIKFALEKFVLDLLPVYDSLERGVTEISAGNGSLESLQKGTELTLDILLKALNKHKVTQINPIAEVFNPELHEAVSMVSLPDTQPNTIHQVLQKGYLLNGRLVRPAMVIVTKT